MSRRLSWPAGLRAWRRWIILVLVLVLVRAALPFVLRWVIASQASQALHARVEVGDVELALYRGGVTLNDVAVYAIVPTADAGAATGGATPAATPPPAAGSRVPAPEPLIAWKRFAVAVHWLPLVRKAIVLREVELDSPRVSLARLADGQLNLMALVPTHTAEPAPTPTPAEAAPTSNGWGFGLDHLILREGGLRFRDLKVKDSEPIELNIPTVEVTDVFLIPGQYGEPSHLSVTVAVDKGSLQLEGTLVLRSATESHLETYLKARSLPLRRARLYIPEAGWSAMEGGLDADLVYTLDTGTESAVRGSATVNDFAVRVASLTEPALAWKSLEVKIDPLDLRARHVVVSAIELNDATLLVRPQGGDLLPFLSSPTGAGEAATTTAPAPAVVPPESTPPWRWSVSSAQIADSRVRLLGADAPVDVGVGLHLTDLADHTDQPAHVALALTAGHGSLNADGRLRIAPPGFGGSLKIADMSLPELAVAAGVLSREQLQAVRLNSDLTVEAGLAASTGDVLAPTDVRVHGKLSLADVRAAPPGLSAVARSIDLTLTELQVPGVLPAHHAEAAVDESGDAGLSAGDLRGRAALSVADLNVTAAGPRGYALGAKSIDLALSELLVRGGIPVAQRNAAAGAPSGDVRLGGRLALADFKLAGTDAKAFLVDIHSLEAPFKELTLPRVLAPAHADVAAPPTRLVLGDVTVTAPHIRLTRAPEGLTLPAFSSAPRPSDGASPPVPAPAAPPTPAVEVTVDTLGLTDGTVTLDDRTVKPFYQGGLSALSVQVKKVRWPRLAIGDLRVAATGAEGGKLDVFGAFDPDTGWLEIDGDKLALVPFNPYATSFSGYSIDTGKASFVTKVSFGQGSYYASTYLTLYSLNVSGSTGEALFQQQFGVPLSMALALMRDTQGDIGLDIPVTVDSQGATIGLLTVIRGALQRAILGALESPLKLVGAAFGGDKVKAVVPAAITFRPGRIELTPAGGEQIEQLAALLASRPGIGVTLETAVTDADVHWLREQALREEWAGEGMFAKLKGMAQGSTRDHINRALEARAKDEEGKLDPDDAASLDRWLDERPAIPAEQLRALAAARLAHVEGMLRDQYGIQAERITHRDPTPDAVAGAPVVRVELGPVAAP